VTSSLEGGGGQHHAPAALPPGKTRYPLYRRLGGPQGQTGRVRKISPPPGFFKLNPLLTFNSLHGSNVQMKNKLVSFFLLNFRVILGMELQKVFLYMFLVITLITRWERGVFSTLSDISGFLHS
jgi:hypothetical protein